MIIKSIPFLLLSLACVAHAQPAPSFKSANDNKSLSTLDIVEFGAVGDGTTDNSGAFSQVSSAATSLISSGSSVSIKIPAGKYKTSTPIQINADNNYGGHISVTGDGSSSVIMPTGTISAIDVEIKKGDVNFDISHLVVSKSFGAAGGEAVEIHSYSGPMGHGFLNDIVCDNLSSDGSKSPFHSCIHMRNVIRTDVSHVKNLYNAPGNGDPNAGIGIWEDGTDGLYTVDNHVRDLQQTDGFAYILLTGHVEGLTVDALTGLGGAYGVYAPGRSWSLISPGKDKERYPNNYLLWMTVTNSHINSYLRGIYAVSANSVKISNSLFYNTMLGSSNNIIPVYPDHSYLPLTTANQGGNNIGGYSYIGVDLVNPSWSHVYSNEIQSANAQGSTGLSVQKIDYDGTQDSCINNFVYSNISIGSTAASMSFGPGISKSFIYDNVIDGQYYNGSTGNIYYNNKSNGDF